MATPEGAGAQVKYIFSVTNAVPEVIDADEYLTAIASGLAGGGAASLAGYPPAGGPVGLRELIAQRLASNRGFNASPDDVFIADGAGGAITILLDSFINPGDPVLVEEFTYMGSLRMMMERGAEPIHVPSDEDGMLPDAVEDILSSLDTAGRRAKFIWTIPVLSKPAWLHRVRSPAQRPARRGRTLGCAHPGERVLRRLPHRRRPVGRRPMSGMRDNADVMYVSSFTKLLGCGLRVGFGVLPPGRQGRLAPGQRPKPAPAQRQPSGHHAGV